MAVLDEGASSGAIIIIVAVVVFGLIAATLFTRMMLNQSRARMMEEATTRHSKIAELADEKPLTTEDNLVEKDMKTKPEYINALDPRATNALLTAQGTGI